VISEEADRNWVSATGGRRSSRESQPFNQSSATWIGWIHVSDDVSRAPYSNWRSRSCWYQAAAARAVYPRDVRDITRHPENHLMCLGAPRSLASAAMNGVPCTVSCEREDLMDCYDAVFGHPPNAATYYYRRRRGSRDLPGRIPKYP